MSPFDNISPPPLSQAQIDQCIDICRTIVCIADDDQFKPPDWPMLVKRCREALYPETSPDP